MAFVFNGNDVKNSPEAFDGVVLKSYIHPIDIYNDGYTKAQYQMPDVGFSFGLFEICVGKSWPATRFDVSEVSYCLEGDGVFICDGVEHRFGAGDVIYIPKGEVRIIHNKGDTSLKYLCIVDPAWEPKYESVL
ncbi:MAG: cupin domain-containing protein [Alphaproteobacteria bacterium]|jgi:mannose-6-phosphate isomerase-like protein (cupin superfamily)|nr:cupin domain-containing protein [Candidatus Jidaibacter sp.]